MIKRYEIETLFQQRITIIIIIIISKRNAELFHYVYRCLCFIIGTLDYYRKIKFSSV